MRVNLRKAALESLKLQNTEILLYNNDIGLLGFKYERGADSAPVLVHKSQGGNSKIALEVARKNGITVHRANILVENLFSNLNLNDEIPEDHYKSMALHLAQSIKDGKDIAGQAWAKEIICNSVPLAMAHKYELDYDGYTWGRDVAIEKPEAPKINPKGLPGFYYPDHVRLSKSINSKDFPINVILILQMVTSNWLEQRNIPVIFRQIDDDRLIDGHCEFYLRGLKQFQLDLLSIEDPAKSGLNLVHFFNETFHKNPEAFINVESVEYLLKNIKGSEPDIVAYMETDRPSLYSNLIYIMKYLVRLYKVLPDPLNLLQTYVQYKRDKIGMATLLDELGTLCAEQLFSAADKQSIDDRVKLFIFEDRVVSELLNRAKADSRIFTYDQFQATKTILFDARVKAESEGYIPLFIITRQLFDNFCFSSWHQLGLCFLPSEVVFLSEYNAQEKYAYEFLNLSSVICDS
ncbi:MAG: EscU/YscU/HrcU family type III secretion system export apparatus switch protein [bacterium]|nr:EscU/YscU/HrcU family type III secretion system export apparatus switch protein [bacterium]